LGTLLMFERQQQKKTDALPDCVMTITGIRKSPNRRATTGPAMIKLQCMFTKLLAGLASIAANGGVIIWQTPASWYYARACLPKRWL